MLEREKTNNRTESLKKVLSGLLLVGLINGCSAENPQRLTVWEGTYIDPKGNLSQEKGVSLDPEATCPPKIGEKRLVEEEVKIFDIEIHRYLRCVKYSVIVPP